MQDICPRRQFRSCERMRSQSSSRPCHLRVSQKVEAEASPQVQNHRGNGILSIFQKKRRDLPDINPVIDVVSNLNAAWENPQGYVQQGLCAENGKGLTPQSHWQPHSHAERCPKPPRVLSGYLNSLLLKISNS